MLNPKNLDQISRGILRYLEKTGQINLLPALVETFSRQVKDQTDFQLAHLTTTIPLTDSQLSDLKSALVKLFHQPIKVKSQIDPNLIGGLTIRLGDQLIDLSLKSQLDQLHHQLTT